MIYDITTSNLLLPIDLVCKLGLCCFSEKVARLNQCRSLTREKCCQISINLNPTATTFFVMTYCQCYHLTLSTKMIARLFARQPAIPVFSCGSESSVYFFCHGVLKFFASRSVQLCASLTTNRKVLRCSEGNKFHPCQTTKYNTLPSTPPVERTTCHTSSVTCILL